MKTALFVNFTDQEFTGYWNGKGRMYPAGTSEAMPDYLAKHFAKHLVNRELLRTKPDGQLVYKDGDKMTSPKFPEQVPVFMDLFNKSYIPDDLDVPGEPTDTLDAVIRSANINKEKKLAPKNVAPLSKPRKAKEQESEDFKRETGDIAGPQVVLPPDWNEDDEESQFKGKPKE